jgi:hypothetical protein
MNYMSRFVTIVNKKGQLMVDEVDKTYFPIGIDYQHSRRRDEGRGFIRSIRHIRVKQGNGNFPDIFYCLEMKNKQGEDSLILYHDSEIRFRRRKFKTDFLVKISETPAYAMDKLVEFRRDWGVANAYFDKRRMEGVHRITGVIDKFLYTDKGAIYHYSEIDRAATIAYADKKMMRQTIIDWFRI